MPRATQWSDVVGDVAFLAPDTLAMLLDGCGLGGLNVDAADLVQYHAATALYVLVADADGGAQSATEAAWADLCLRLARELVERRDVLRPALRRRAGQLVAELRADPAWPALRDQVVAAPCSFAHQALGLADALALGRLVASGLSGCDRLILVLGARGGGCYLSGIVAASLAVGGLDVVLGSLRPGRPQQTSKLLARDQAVVIVDDAPLRGRAVSQVAELVRSEAQTLLYGAVPWIPDAGLADHVEAAETLTAHPLLLPRSVWQITRRLARPLLHGTSGVTPRDAFGEVDVTVELHGDASSAGTWAESRFRSVPARRGVAHLADGRRLDVRATARHEGVFVAPTQVLEASPDQVRLRFEGLVVEEEIPRLLPASMPLELLWEPLADYVAARVDRTKRARSSAGLNRQALANLARAVAGDERAIVDEFAETLCRSPVVALPDLRAERSRWRLTLAGAVRKVDTSAHTWRWDAGCYHPCLTAAAISVEFGLPVEEALGLGQIACERSSLMPLAARTFALLVLYYARCKFGQLEVWSQHWSTDVAEDARQWLLLCRAVAIWLPLWDDLAATAASPDLPVFPLAPQFGAVYRAAAEERVPGGSSAAAFGQRTAEYAPAVRLRASSDAPACAALVVDDRTVVWISRAGGRLAARPGPPGSPGNAHRPLLGFPTWTADEGDA